MASKLIQAMKLSLLIFILLPLLISAGDDDCGASDGGTEGVNKSEALVWKIVALVSILFFGGIGVSLYPFLGKYHPSLHPDGNTFFVIKSLAAGVILATAFIHILPDAQENLTSPCLGEHPWGDFPFAGFFAMVAAILTFIIDSYAFSYFSSRSSKESHELDVEKGSGSGDHGHDHANVVHTHATHGHSHGAIGAGSNEQAELTRHRIIAHVLELGIIVHSVIIGISLGVSPDASEIRTLAIALTFHQFFEGMGLGGCLSQAKLNVKSLIWNVLFFALTTPLGIGVGIGISDSYNPNSPTALIVGGILNAAASGILIYMSLVDLLAADFMNMNKRLFNNMKLMTAAFGALLLGAGCMSVLAKWA